MSALAISMALASAGSFDGSALPAQPSIETVNDRILASHNQERARVGQAPLRWSDALAVDALKWARHLADTRTFDHSPAKEGEEDQGENLWMGTLGAYSPDDMVQAWVDERHSFRAGIFPKISATGNWVDVGHYTQLVWYNTTEVGCAEASNQSDDYLVCRYYPPGNWMDQNPLGPRNQKLALHQK
jgi:hypothetical protein